VNRNDPFAVMEASEAPDLGAAKQLFAELTGTALSTALIMTAGVVTGLLSARALGPLGRGELTAATIWPSTILYAGTLGLPEATAYLAASRRTMADSVFVTAQSVALALGVIASIAGWFALPFVLDRQGAAAQAYARLYLLAFSIPALSSLCACAWLQGAGKLKELNVARAAVHIVTALSMGILYLAGFASVRNFLIALLFGNAATWLLALMAWRVQRGPSAEWRPELIRPMLSYGSRVQFGTWSAAANIRLDQLMLSSFGASASLGLYVVALGYAGLVMTLPGVAGLVMLPRLVRAHAAGSGGELLTTWYRRVLWATAGAGFGLWLVASVAMPLLFGGEFAGAVSLEALVIPGCCILGMNQLLTVGFRGHGLPGVASRAELVGLLVTVPLLVMLLPRYGIYGAALASLCAYSASCVYLLSKVRGLVTDRQALWKPTSADWLDFRKALLSIASVIPSA